MTPVICAHSSAQKQRLETVICRWWRKEIRIPSIKRFVVRDDVTCARVATDGLTVIVVSCGQRGRVGLSGAGETVASSGSRVVDKGLLFFNSTKIAKEGVGRKVEETQRSLLLPGM